MNPGNAQLTWGQTETIGLPGKSSLNILLSANFEVPTAESVSAYAYFQALINNAMMLHVETFMRELLLWPDDQAPYTDHLDPIPAMPTLHAVEITASVTNKIGMPNWNFVSVLASAKSHAAPGQEASIIDNMMLNVKYQLAMKQEIIKATPRPWIQNNYA